MLYAEAREAYKKFRMSWFCKMRYATAKETRNVSKFIYITFSNETFTTYALRIV